VTKLTADQVRHIAKLARLRLTDAEVEKFAPELSSILQYIDKLSEVNTENIEPTAQVTGLTNKFREDEIKMDNPSPDSLLQTSALSIIDHQIATPPAHG
jgi:aspartyl-tRNA(Asn)/glutamyl-tRNA(Gln) amidotransferase subunit C